MSAMNSDRLHRSTLGIYSSLMDELNPSLQKLVSLGNSYVQAFKALAVTSEAYFSALSQIGEKAFYTMSSSSLGDVLIQISESQRRLTLELEGVFRWFGMEVLHEMDSSIRLDKDYLSSSRRHYELEVHNQAASLQRQLRTGASQDSSEYVQFLMASHEQALKEEERRYRFLAEKHCGFIQSIIHVMDKTGGSLQQRANTWKEKADATRQSEARRATTLGNAVGMKEEIGKRRAELPLGNIPSRAPSPQGSSSGSAAHLAGNGPEGRSTRALVSHQPAGSNPTLLPFTRGEIITVLIGQPRNGWLYGRADTNSRQGWFPASFVELVDDPPKSARSSNSTLRSSSSMSSLLNQPESSSHNASTTTTTTQPIVPIANSENKRSQPQGSRPELFPRGTNPFATVKLKPTSTNDRSAPRLHRR
uniref:brain-specific angiogenesis inhibitor 1-associated protein 2-like protein 2 n=1 Tax=Monopterus albus TaxID=43700 RepID=UPI0009B4C4E8|nr:brain-specific angiogenesis inhibitor 1-associated protein 2-like protein 2 [Monopterus albus]